MSCENKVAAFPHPFCEGCLYNGCYPWNEHPLLCCQVFGGLFFALIEVDHETNVAVRCLVYKPVDDDVWNRYLLDKKVEASSNEVLRRKAVDGEVYTNQTLPEHRWKTPCQ
jgi:hypothetical protein